MLWAIIVSNVAEGDIIFVVSLQQLQDDRGVANFEIHRLVEER